MERNARSREYQRAIAPFLREYDELLRSMFFEVKGFQKDLRQVRMETVGLITSNRCLHRDLRRQVEQNLSSNQEYSDKLLKDLQSQLETLLKDKEATLKMLQTSMREVDRLESLLNEKKNHVDRTVFEETVSQMRSDHLMKLRAVSSELERTKHELLEANKNLHNANLREARYSEPICSIQQRLEAKEKQLDETLRNLQSAQGRLIALEEAHAEVVARLSASEAEASALKEKCSDQSREVDICRSKSHALQEQLSNALLHAQESVSVAEKALFEKQEAELALNRAEQEVADLRASLDCIIDEASQRTASEIDKVRVRSNQCIKELVAQVGTLEQALKRQSTTLESLSEKNADLKAEVDRLQSIQVALRSNRDPAFRELGQSLAQAEKLCEERRLLIDSLRDELSEQSRRHTLEVKRKEAESEQLRKALREMERRTDELLTLRVDSEGQAMEARQRLQVSEAESAALRRTVETEVAELQEALRQRQAEHTAKLQHTEERCEKKLMDLQSLLEAHKTMNDRWKTEASKMASEYETEIRAARTKASSLRKLNSDLRKKLVRAQTDIRKEKKRGDLYSSKLKNLARPSGTNILASLKVIEDQMPISHWHNRSYKKMFVMVRFLLQPPRGATA
ncbi:myosin-14 [Ixodes scapularis]|uniref:myosin-14 n=1 Tax=Ixodes scapularis TaxID=6945 RepID=UPI001AD70080|nr:myosin-14 [Ixodes scapularis]